MKNINVTRNDITDVVNYVFDKIYQNLPVMRNTRKPTTRRYNEWIDLGYINEKLFKQIDWPRYLIIVDFTNQSKLVVGGANRVSELENVKETNGIRAMLTPFDIQYVILKDVKQDNRSRVQIIDDVYELVVNRLTAFKTRFNNNTPPSKRVYTLFDEIK